MGDCAVEFLICRISDVVVDLSLKVLLDQAENSEMRLLDGFFKIGQFSFQVFQ